MITQFVCCDLARLVHRVMTVTCNVTLGSNTISSFPPKGTFLHFGLRQVRIPRTIDLYGEVSWTNMRLGDCPWV